MQLRMKKIQIIVFIATLAILTVVWSVNGYDDTWLYVMAAFIAVPTSWFFLGKGNKGQ